MQMRWLLIVVVLILPTLACNLSSADPTIAPTSSFIGTVPTSQTLIVTATSPATVQASSATPNPTATRFSNTNGGSTNLPPAFSGLSFGTTAGSANQTSFPNGTEEVYVRWNYSNVPVGTTLRRVWYRDGNVVVSREEAWSSNWGSTGRLTHIKLFDNEEGLDPGNYYVVVSLPSYGVSIDGNFTILAGSPSFSDISVSMTSNGEPMTVFPYGTQEIFVRWNYNNIPVGAVMQREWYRNGVAVVSRSEAWSANWGMNGRLTHISLYDFDSGFGLDPGNYRVVVYLRDQPAVSVEKTFTIESNAGPSFADLRFASSPQLPAQSTFPAATKRVYAIWEYQNVPVGAQMRRIWKRDGQVFADRTEVWDFNAYGTAGTMTDVYIYDDISGLSSGNYQVEIQLVGQPLTKITGSFSIAP